MKSKPSLKWLFWIALAAFLAWDWTQSSPIDLRNEPPAIAIGSGKTPMGGHCSMAK